MSAVDGPIQEAKMISIAVGALAATATVAVVGAARSYRSYKNVKSSAPFRKALLDLAQQLSEQHGGASKGIDAVVLGFVHAAAGEPASGHPAGSTSGSVGDVMEELRLRVGDAADLVFSGICLMVVIRMIEAGQMGQTIYRLSTDNPPRFSEHFRRAFGMDGGEPSKIQPVAVARSLVADGFPAAVRMAREMEYDLVAA